jgi:hypothetical protein
MMKELRFFGLAAALFLFAPGAFAANVQMSGHVDYATHGSRVRLYVEEINNFSDMTTDRLRLRLWASEDHWNEFDPGRLIAFFNLPRLYPYQTLDDVHPRVLLNIPPNGWYHVTLTLEERVMVEFDGERYFRRNFVGWPFPF